jgi:DNA repair protein RadC
MNVKLRSDEKTRVLNGVDLYEVMQKILKRSSKIDQKKEHFWVVGLDVTQEILFIELVGLGNSNSVSADPKHIFGLALKKHAHLIVLVHNHPSGNLRPSEADESLTNRMIFVGRFMNIPVWDHLIITEKSYYSFLDSGLLFKLESDTENVPNAVLEEIMKREAAEFNFVKASSENVFAMYKDGLSHETIAKYSGLEIDEISKLISEFEAGQYED